MDIPKLHYAEGISNNFADFKRKLALKATYEYGNLARIIETPGAGYWVPEASYPGDPLIYNAAEDSFERQMERAKVIKSSEARDKFIEDMKADRPALFALIFAHLTPASEHKVKEEAAWDAVFAARDPLELWKLISKTHIAPTTGQTEIDKMSIRRIYSGLAQGKSETIYDFRERFQRTLEMRKGLGLADFGADEIAQDFLDKLDPARFESMKTALMNGLRAFPKTIQEVYTMASNWRVDGGKLAAFASHSQSATLRDGTDPSSKTTESSSSSSSSTVFKTSETDPPAQNNPNGKNKKKNKNKGSNNKGPQQQQQTSNRPSDSDDDDSDEKCQFRCFGCGSCSHNLQNCPEFLEFKAQRNKT
jgi:hypothetical protein